MSYIVETFDGINWNKVSTHTQEVDAQMQVELFKGQSIDPTDIRIINLGDLPDTIEQPVDIKSPGQMQQEGDIPASTPTLTIIDSIQVDIADIKSRLDTLEAKKS